jgi:hypothetical protein
MLRLAVQPPPHANPGVPLYPPLAARLSSETSVFSELSQTWAVATLIHYSGEVLHDQLGGKVADSAHPLPESGLGTNNSNVDKDRAYFYFPGLVISEPGRYRVRVSLMRMDYSSDGPTEGVVRVLETVDSRSITVDDGAISHSRPGKWLQDSVTKY